MKAGFRLLAALVLYGCSGADGGTMGSSTALTAAGGAGGGAGGAVGGSTGLTTGGSGTAGSAGHAGAAGSGGVDTTGTGGVAGEAGSSNVAGSGGQGELGGSGGMTGGAGGAGGAADPHDSFQIHVDYSFDTNGVFEPAQRQLVEHAAGSWMAFIASEFEDVPAGTQLRARDPEAADQPGMIFNLDYDIDDVVVIVGFAPNDGMGGTLGQSSSSFTQMMIEAQLGQRLAQRFFESPYQPWIAMTTFDEEESWFFDTTPDTADDIPAGQSDFLTTALHEMGHVLGFGSSAAFDALVVNNAFEGPRAMEVFGGPVPLADDGIHFARNTMSGSRLPVMEYGSALGERKTLTELDLAVLEDIGYEIRWDLFNAATVP